MNRFSIDGTEYDVLVTDYKETFSVVDTDKSKRTITGDMYRDVVGTFYNYTITLRRGPGCAVADWDALWDTLSQPVESHTCIFWHNQKELSQEMYVTGGERKLTRREPKVGLRAGTNHWGEITIDFVAMHPQIYA